MDIFEILLLHVLSNDACKFAIKLFPIIWGPFENVNLLYFLLKMHIWDGCIAPNIAGNPIKDINVNLSFLSSGSKVVEWTPARSDISWTFLKFYFCNVLSPNACKFGVNLFLISWGPFENVHLLYLCNWKWHYRWLYMHQEYIAKLIKDIICKYFISEFRIQSCGMDPCKYWHLMDIFEILLLNVLSNDACKFAIKLFPIIWGPFENVNLLYFLLKMHIWDGCIALNIAGNPIKDINVNLSFLSSGSKVVEWTPARLTSHGHFWNSTFECTVQWCMQICHKPFSHHLRTIWKC